MKANIFSTFSRYVRFSWIVLLPVTWVRAGDDYAGAVQADNPALYYRFSKVGEDRVTVKNEGTAGEDVSGTATDDSMLGESVTGPAEGFAGFPPDNRGAGFHGQQWISLGTQDRLLDALNDAAAVTVEVWLKLSSLPATGKTYTIFNIPGGSAGPTALAFDVLPDGNIRMAGRSVYRDEYVSHEFAVGLAPDEWVHLAGVFDYGSGKLRFYKNGELVGDVKAAFTGHLVINNTHGQAEVGIGNFKHAEKPARAALQGYLDELAIYKGELGADKIAAHYAAAKADGSAAAKAEKWRDQAAADSREDRTTVAYDGVKPDSMVCDTALRKMPDGTWALFLLAGGDREPDPKNYIGVTRSKDEGETWSPLEAVDVGIPRTGDTVGQGATEIIVRGKECIMFFSTHAYTWGEKWRSWITRSMDDGRTWSKPEPLPGRLKDFTFVRNAIVTRDGRIMAPFQHYVGPDAGRKPPDKRFDNLFHYVANPRNGVLVSSDGGRTWKEYGDIRLTEDNNYHGWAENNIVELSDGRIAMIIRGDRLGGVLYYAESTDGGKTWPAFAKKTNIPNPGSKATLYPLGGDAVALLHNPNSNHRSPLALWVTFDGMKTWPYRRILVNESSDGAKGRLNYPDGFVSEDRKFLQFAYDDNRHRAVYYGAKLPPVDTQDR